MDGGRHYGRLENAAGLCPVLRVPVCPGGNGPWPGIPSGRDCFCRAVRTEQLQTHGTDCLRTEEGFAEKGNAALFWYSHVLLECRYRSDYAAGRRGSLPGYERETVGLCGNGRVSFTAASHGGSRDWFWPLHLSHHCAFYQSGGKIPVDFAGIPHRGKLPALG